MTHPVSILIVARDRYSRTEECLDTLLRRTSAPERVVCLDAGSPRSVAAYLRAVSRKHGVEVLRHEAPLSAQAARHFGLQHLGDSQRTVVMENDVIVEPGWLDALLLRAESDPAADIVVPLVNRVMSERIHLPWKDLANQDTSSAGGERPQPRFSPSLSADPAWAGCLLASGPAQQFAARFDPGAGLVTSHWDLWLELHQAGARVCFEPRAVVTSCRKAALKTWDEPFFASQWNNEGIRQSVDYFCRKWGLEATHPSLQALTQQALAARTTLTSRYRFSRFVGHQAVNWWKYIADPWNGRWNGTRPADAEFEAA